jgi:transposase
MDGLVRMESNVMDDASAILSLPDDPAILKSILAQRTRERDESNRRRDEAEIKALRLEVELLRLKKLYYGPRADRLTQLSDVNQLLLEFAADWESRAVNPGDVADVAAEEIQTIRRVRRGRRNLAALAHLPVTRTVHDLPEDQKACPCCGTMRQKIGEETTWQIEYIPGRFERIEHVQVKYACQRCGQNAENPNIALAAKPLQAIDKGLASPGLLAYVVTSKYSDYLPLYRLQNIFERNGFEIDRATQSVWCGDVADLLKPLYGLMVRRVLRSHVICTDDTVMPMLAPEKTKQARLWVYIGDQANPYNVFDFTLGRGRDGPMTFLKEFRQTLLADAYGGYDGVVVGNDITRAGCWAHARRKFVDAEKTNPAIAAEAVGIIRQLYALEHQVKDLSASERLCLRQTQSQPILTRLRDRLWAWKDQLLPKHPMAEAVNYCLNQWNELSVFAGDGAVPIDNNVSERDVKRIVLNRKNSLFVGNERGGATAAILSSLASTCKRHGVDPQRYLTSVLTNIGQTNLSGLEQFLPDQWKQGQASPPPRNEVDRAGQSGNNGSDGKGAPPGSRQTPLPAGAGHCNPDERGQIARPNPRPPP